MNKLLAILAIAVFTFVVLVVVAFFAFRRKFRRMASAIAAAFTPPEITLEPLAEAPPEEVERRVRTLEALGFANAGRFSVKEMPGVTLVGLAHEAGRAWGVVYLHPEAGVWSDVAVRYEDAGGLTVSSAPTGGGLDQRPGYRKLFELGASEQGLFERLKAERAKGAPLRPAVASEFKAVFEQAYRDELDWRLSRGGATLQEVQRIAAATPGRFSDEDVALAREAIAARAAVDLLERCRDSFAATMDGASWEKLREHAVVVHERMEPDAVWDAFAPALDHDELAGDVFSTLEGKVTELLKTGRPALELASAINELLPQRARCRPAGELQAPVRAVLLLAP